MAGGKSELARLAKESALRAGMTIVVATPQTVTKWKRVWKRGRYVDVAENLKPMPGVELDGFWVDEFNGS